MLGSLKKDLVHIYGWQLLSLCTRFASLLIVVPLLAGDSELFGIYSICVSIVMYLSYADFGFLASGQKFAAEAFAAARLQDEISITGFTFFILVVMFIPFVFIGCYLAFAPTILINGLSDINFPVAQNLLLIIGLLVPIQILLERLSICITAIRLKDYLVTRVNVGANMVKIFGIFLFQDGEGIRLAEYFLFTTLISILVALLVTIMVSKRLGYDLKLLIVNIRFDKVLYSRLSKLSWNTFLLTIAFMIYYEADLIIIGKLMGPEEVALYAVGFTLINFLRNIFNIIYAPFSHRLNHFAGVKNTESMVTLFHKLIFYGLPFYVISLTILVLVSEYLIIYWVGVEYEDSIWLAKLLFISLAFGFLVKPAGYFFNSTLNYGYIRMLAIVGVLVFLGSLLVLYPQYGLASFAISKILVGFSLFVVCIYGLRSHVWVLRELIKIMPVLLICFITLVMGLPYLLDSIFEITGKSILNLSILFLLCSAIFLISLSSIFISSKSVRTEIKRVLSS